MKRNIIYTAACLVAFASCQKQEVAEAPSQVEVAVELTASAAADATKTVMTEHNALCWSVSDKISLFYTVEGKTGHSVFTSKNSEPAASAKFAGSLSLPAEDTDLATVSALAVYPATTADASDGTSVNITVPSEQTAVEGSFMEGAYPVVAQTSDLTAALSFKAVCGGVKVSFRTPGITSFTFDAKGAKIAGTASVKIGKDGTPVATLGKGAVSEITVNAPAGGFEVGKWYYMTAFPATLTSGYTVTLSNGESFGGTSSISIKRSVFGVLDSKDAKPIETENLWMIGDATPTGWMQWVENPDSSEPLKRISQYVFQYEGILTPGELRATPHYGWGAHIRPLMQHVEIGENGVANPSFMYVDQPDFCWYVTKQGNYRITFDLENYTITAEYLDNPGSEKTPIETETLFMVGTSTNGAWDGNAMTAFTQNTSDKYLFSYEGNLYEGEMKVYTQSGDDYPDNWAIRPAGGNAEIGKASITDTEFAFSYEPDDKWKVTESGMYRLTFNLRNWTMSCMYIGECQIDKNIKPVNASALYLLGDAAPSGWNVQNPTPMVKSSSYVFVYEGHLNAGRLRATPIKDWGAHIRPWVDNTSITTAGVSAANLTYVKFPDYNWNVETAGNYKLTIDLEHWTIKAEYLGQ